MPPKPHNHIICVYDDRYEIAGPFDSREALMAYGERWEEENGDNPCWKSIYLADAHAAPVVVAP